MDDLEASIASMFEDDDDDWEEECLNSSRTSNLNNTIAKDRIDIKDEDAPRLEHLEVLSRCFGHKNFRPMQWKIISSIINERRDNCAVMATGYGKSLCYQFPSVYCGGITIVISPLISLMEDQVLSLKMLNISACLLGTAQANQKQVVKEIFENKYSLVYLTPEFCCGEYGIGLLKEMTESLSIILIAIDEAHCVSTWGHDFRFQYRELGKIKITLPNIPILAVTATATSKVREDIIKSLQLKNPQVLCSGFDRPNLYFSVYLKAKGIFQDLKQCMVRNGNDWKFSGSTIIYCITRKHTEEISEILSNYNIVCSPYHAGLTMKQRKDIHEQFVRDKLNVVVATIAFGMGIDKPDVRNVIHYGAPKDIESYYQEVGRAGRDGQSAKCTVFYNNSDFYIHRTMRENSYGGEKTMKKKEQMEQIIRKYLESRNCRREFILKHFEGTVVTSEPQQNCCDNCQRKLEAHSSGVKYVGVNEQDLYDFTEDAKTFLSVVNIMGGKFGIGMYILFLRGSRSSKLYKSHQEHQLHGCGKQKSENWWKAIAGILDTEKLLDKQFHKKGKGVHYHTIHVSDKGTKFLDCLSKYPDKTKLLLQPNPEIYRLLKQEPVQQNLESSGWISTQELPPLKPCTVTSNVPQESQIEKEERMKIYRILLNKRTDIASQLDCMPYMVASNEALMKMSQLKPVTLQEFRNCQLEGFTEAKIQRFAKTFIETICTLCNVTNNPSQNKKTILEVLIEYPLENVKLGASAEATYSFYKSGLTVHEIATKRGVLVSTILSHLADAIKVGYPIKMIELNVTEEIRDCIINVIMNPPINSDMSRIAPIKQACPPEITFDNIKIVVAYLQVRQHLNSLNIPYEDFEEPVNITEICSSSNKNVTIKTKNEQNSDSEDSLVFDSVPNKKQKLNDDDDDDDEDMLLLRQSPPRQKKVIQSEIKTQVNGVDFEQNINEDKDDEKSKEKLFKFRKPDIEQKTVLPFATQ